MKKNKNINLSILLTGLFLIGAGILQLLFVTGHIPMEYKSIIFSWEMLLVASGIICLFSRFRFCSIMGIILMAAGAIFLINQNALNIPAFDYLSHNIWPLLLIFLGLLIIIRSFFMKN